MADKETIEDIIAEMETERPGLMNGPINTNNLYYARRLKAALERERGNAAKLREACANIAEYARSAQCHTEDAHVLGYLNQIEGWANAALAAPARNCDVGMAEEQAQRYSRGLPFPPKQGDYEFWKYEHLLRWAQMPCEEGGAK